MTVMRPILFAVAVLIGPLGSLAALYTNPYQLPAHFYDYIIVGGASFFPISQWSSSNLSEFIAGNAGNVLASRLTENTNITVLVLEAGVRYAMASCHFPIVLQPITSHLVM